MIAVGAQANSWTLNPRTSYAGADPHITTGRRTDRPYGCDEAASSGVPVTIAAFSSPTPGGHVLAAIDIHKAVFQTAVLNPDDGEIVQQRFPACREALVGWIDEREGSLSAVAIEATTGWRSVARELQARGVEVRLCDPGQASALQGNRKRPKTDRLDARWLVLLLARELLPHAWMAPADIQRLRDQTRLRKALTDDHTRWAQRLHSLLVHEGWPCSRGSLLTDSGRRWVAAIRLDPVPRAHITAMLSVMATLSHQIDLN
jgi:transposase